MRSDAGRDGGGLGEEQYWRRRATALVGVFGVIAVLGWACSASGGEGAQVVNSPAVPSVPAVLPTVTVTAEVTKTARPVAQSGGACDPESVVVTMSAARDVHGPGERPEFHVTAVNTGPLACAFDVGPRGLDLRITSGEDRVWSSADCARGAGAPARTLRRGVPYVGTVTWDRRRCAGERARARPGTYVAAVHSASAYTPKQVFWLR
ncbi:hypothetical protein GCM10010191_41060 [Actinomadura vinacea]|uniref:DUF4232 domain-containing protein n=1 Tax=Actinomadura vinacea TaxID=115336 RepID=A0ABP5WCK7_9ACTN